MNDHLKISPHGLRLIQDFEGAPRLTARLCEGGAWELGWGCTYYPDSSPVKQGDTIDASFAPVMLAHAVKVTEDAVKRLVKVPLNQNQFDGLCGFVYNVGEANAATSTVIRETNAMRLEDAAAAFGMWVFATKAGYKQALRGLLRRRYAEACTYLGYHYTEACADEAVALQREKPATLPGADRVLYKTPFANILRVAQQYPLDAPQFVPDAQPPVLAPTVLEPVQYAPSVTHDSPLTHSSEAIPVQLPIPDEDELLLTEKATASESIPDTKAAAPSHPQPEVEPTAHSVPNTGSSKPASPVPVPIAPQSPPGPVSPLPPVVAGTAGTKPIHPHTKMPDGVPYGVDPTVGAKPMETTERFVGSAMMWLANGLRVGMANGLKLSGPVGFVAVLFLDMMKSPVTAALILTSIMAAIFAVIWFGGVILEKAGLRKKKKGEAAASQLMY